MADTQFPLRFARAMAYVSIVVASVCAFTESPSTLGETRVVDELNPPWGAVGQINAPSGSVAIPLPNWIDLSAAHKCP